MVDTAANELTCRKRLEKQPYDIVLLEETLFPNRGVDFIKKIGIQYPEISIVVLAEDYNRDIAGQLIKSGADHYIRKQSDDCVNFLPDMFHDLIDKKSRENRCSVLLNMKDTLLKEVHHRIKNNFQVLISMIHMQFENSQDESIRNILSDMQNRIRSMSLIHDQLYKSGNHNQIDFSIYVSNLVADLHRYHTHQSNTIELKTDLKPVSLKIDDAIHCGLIINELVSNALTHAFPSSWKQKSEIGISLTLNKPSEIQIEIWDNGCGLPEDSSTAFKDKKGFGLHLVNLLIHNQLNGTLDVKTNPGTHYQIHFDSNH